MDSQGTVRERAAIFPKFSSSFPSPSFSTKKYSVYATRRTILFSLFLLISTFPVLNAEKSDMKKVVIFGSTGMTGLCAVDAAVKKGLQVRAFVRDPAKLPEDLKSKVEVFKGDVLEPDSVNNAVEGMDGVVVVLGTRNNTDPTTDMSEGTKNIIEAMRQEGIKKLSVCLSSFLFFEPSMIPPRFLGIHEDHVRMYEALQSSGLDYVAVCPPHIEDSPSREIQVFINTNKGASRTITKWDLGKFLVDALSEPSYYKNKVLVCNAPKA